MESIKITGEDFSGQQEWLQSSFVNEIHLSVLRESIKEDQGRDKGERWWWFQSARGLNSSFRML